MITKKRIPKSLDRRYKLTDRDRADIIEKYNTGNYTQQDLADSYRVSRTTIVFVLNPNIQEDNKLSERSQRVYDSAIKSSIYNHRAYKKELHKKGLLVEKL